MKKFLYIVLLLGTAACTTENSDDPDGPAVYLLKNAPASDSEASNSANPYDSIGDHYLTLSDMYESLPAKPHINTIVLDSLYSLAGQIGFGATAPGRLTAAELESITNLAETDFSTALMTLSISSPARNHLDNLVGSLNSLKLADAGYDEVFAEFLMLESAVYTSTLSAGEKQILLSTMAITRYDVYSKSRRKRRDRDWELSVGNIMAAAYGATENPVNTIVGGAASEFMN